MIRYLKSAYRQQMFDPTWVGIFVNPFYFARKGLLDAIVGQATTLSGNLLDVGCGSKPYRSYLRVDSYAGLDIDNETNRSRGYADFFYDGKVFPFEDNKFDSILCSQVLEHVFNPDDFLKEVFRVLKPGGKLLLTVPFVWDEHEQPYDFARYSSFGLRHLLTKQGFQITVQLKLGGDVSTLFQLFNAYLYKVSVKFPRPFLWTFTVVVMGAVNLMGILASYVLPKNLDLYLDNLIVAKK
jgi:SAM-dependent methyltransferase